MKKIFTLLFLLFSFVGFSQKIVDRANGASTVRDMRLMAGLNFYAPRYNDTTAANAGSSLGLDTCGALIYTYNTDSYWYRACFPVKHWVQVGSGSSGGTNIYNSNGILTGDRTLSGSNTHALIFDSLSAFGTFSYTDATNYTVIQQDPVEISIRSLNNGVDNFVSVGAGTVQLRAEDSINLSYPGAAPSVATLGSFKLQARSPTGGFADYNGPIGVTDTSQFIGTRYSYSWATNPFAGQWVDATPGTSITTNGVNTVFAGGTFATGNNISLPFYVGMENWVATQRVVVGTKNNTSYGLSFNLTGSIGGTASLGGYFLLSDTTGRVAFTNNGTLPVWASTSSKDATTFIWSAGDTLDLRMQRKDKVVYVTMTNISNGVVASISIPDQYCTVGLFSIEFYGGSWTFINSFSLVYNDIKYASVGGCGNSIFSGSTADNVSLDWWNVATENVAGGTVHMGAGFEQSLQGTLRMNDILNWAKPKTLLVEYGVNDVINAVNIDSFSKRIQRIVSPCIAAGITPVLIGIVPNQTNATVYNDTLRAIASRYNVQFVDVFTTMKIAAGTTLNPLYGPGGSDPHPTQYGHYLMGRQVKDQVSYLWTASAVLNLKSVPTVITPKYYLTRDENGNVSQSYNSFQSDYIQNKLVTNVIGDAQSASIGINGRAVFAGAGVSGLSDFVVPGTGNLANPNFRITAGIINTSGGTLTAGQFNAGNFNVTSNSPQLTGGTFQLSGNPVFLSASPIAFTANNPSGNGITEEFTIDNNTNILANTSHIMRWRNFGTTKGFIDAGGGVHTDSVSGYNFNNSSLYSAQSWTSKKYVDSIGALGLTNPMTTAGDIIYGGSSGTPTRLGAGTSTFVLTSNGAGVAPSWQPVSAGSGIALSALTAAAATNDIDNLNFRQRWRWTTLAGDTAHVINVTSTAAASNAQVGFAVMMKGANGTALQTTTGGYFENTHSGTTSTNIALQAVASGGATNNYAIYTGTSGGTNGAVFLNGTLTTASSFGSISTGASTSITIAQGNGALNASSITNVGLVNGPISIIPLQEIRMNPGNAETWRFNTAANNSSLTNTAGVGTAQIHFKAQTASASTAPMKFTTGTLLTATEGGAVEYDGTDWFGTNSTATRGIIERTVVNVSNSGTATLARGNMYYSFSGTTTTWTLPAISGLTVGTQFNIKNRGSGNITLNSSAGGNDIYDASAVNTLTITPGSARQLVYDGTYFLVY